MTAETAGEIGQYLIDRLDTFPDDAPLPYVLSPEFFAFADAIRQRDSARRWAVDCEQQESERVRCISGALAALDEAACECEPGAKPCVRHEVEAWLRGDR